MMKRLFFLILLAWATMGSGWAQISSQTSSGTPYYLELHTGERIYARKLQYKSPLFKGNYFVLDDSLTFAPEVVKSYQTPEGYFARISTGRRFSDFAQREQNGRITTYFTYRTDYNTYPGMGIGYGGYGYGGMGYSMPTQRRVYYFSKDGSELQPLNYQNLREALADNPGSIATLQQYKRSKTTQTFMYIAGAALTIAGFTQGNRNGGISPLTYAGLGISILPSLLQFTRKDRLSEAIELYNYTSK